MNKLQDMADEIRKLAIFESIVKSPEEFFKHMQGHTDELSLVLGVFDIAENAEDIATAIEKQIPKKVYHFLEDDTFETTCCGIDVTNKDYNFCPNCGYRLGEVEDVEDEDEVKG